MTAMVAMPAPPLSLRTTPRRSPTPISPRWGCGAKVDTGARATPRRSPTPTTPRLASARNAPATGPRADVKLANAKLAQENRLERNSQAKFDLTQRLEVAKRRKPEEDERCAFAVSTLASSEAGCCDIKAEHTERVEQLEALEGSLIAANIKKERLEADVIVQKANMHNHHTRLIESQAAIDAKIEVRREAVDKLKALKTRTAQSQIARDASVDLLAQSVVFARRLHNEYLCLKGNIRVFCRLRGLTASEGNADEVKEPLKVVLSDDEQGMSIESNPRLNVTGTAETTSSWDFEFDHVFGPDASQATVFEEIALLVQSALDGYRVAIFAYGQTGSGKTYTMEGQHEAPRRRTLPTVSDGGHREDVAASLIQGAIRRRSLGLSPNGTDGVPVAVTAGMIPRTVDLIFAEVKKLQQKSGWSFEVYASMVEVYNEVVRDLLVSKTGSREDAASASGGTEASADGPRSVCVGDAAAVHALLRRAARERHVAATLLNDRSSRSHAVFQLTLVGSCEVSGVRKEVEGLLSFVDLAGSERIEKSGATGERLREAQHINKSLSALGDVIEALARQTEKEKHGSRSGTSQQLHVPYRNSKLTMLLKDSLGGDSKALMFVNVSPFQLHQGETLSSLRFASKVHACNVGIAKRHAVIDHH